MVYKNIENRATFRGGGGVYSGSGSVSIQMESDEYTFEKTANPLDWSGEGQLTYRIALTNVSGIDLSDVVVTDTLPTDVSFVQNSVQINGETSSNYDDSELPVITFGSNELLSVTSETPLVITFFVEQVP